MKRLPKILIWILLLGALAAAVVVPKMRATDAAASKPVASAKSHDGKAKPPPPLKVATYTVKTEPFAETVTSSGTLRAEESVDLAAETSGRIVAIHFVEGTRVKRGDLLVKLNDADLRAQYGRATHNLELAATRLKRIEQLLASHLVTQADVDTARNELAVQKDEIAIIQAQIDRTEVRAPFDGVVGLRYVSEGAYITGATQVATLSRLDKLKIDFSVPEQYASRIRVGAPLSFRVSGADHAYQGVVYAYDPRIEQATRTVLIRAELPNTQNRLLSGAFANVELKLSQLENAILVPSVAVVPGFNQKNVYVVKDGHAVMRPVETGTRTEDRVLIVSGLAPGEVIVTSALQQMRDGIAVVSLDAKTVETAAP